MPKDSVPTLYLEIVEQGDSGFFIDGTQNTNYAQQLRTPTINWIPTEGVKVFEDKDAKGNTIRRNRVIRHIKGCESNDPKEQELLGFKPNRNNDKIPFEHGFATIRREGATMGTYDFLKDATYFLDNQLRPDTATALYKEIKVNERAVELLDEDELLTKAKLKVYSLRINTGDNDKNKTYKYHEDKINSYCSLLNVTADTPEQKLIVIMNNAVSNPRGFLELIVKAENTIITEVTHALHYGVIMFDGNTAQYTKESKLITNLGSAKLSEARKIEGLANFLQTPEGNNELTELRAKVEIAKDKDFNK